MQYKHTTLDYTTLIALHYTNYIELHYTTPIASLQLLEQLLLPQLQLQLHYTAVHYSYRCSCNYDHTTLHNATLH